MCKVLVGFLLILCSGDELELRGGEEISYSPYRRESLFHGLLFMCAGFGEKVININLLFIILRSC